jgi:hypothetical protein
VFAGFADAKIAEGGTILTSRDQLNAALGSTSSLEDFEDFDLGGAPLIDIPNPIDASTVLGPQGRA